MSETEKKLHGIQCTQCAAPLTLHGGHKVRSITCSYCGSVLDTREEYQVVRQFTDRQRPPVPFQLGMTGQLKGVEFTIIGLVQYQTPGYSGWVELFLFSPTHGYAWLEIDGAHFMFSRRVRDLPDKPVSPVTKTTFQARGRIFQVFERYQARITYVEGELTWVAQIGDTVTLIDAIDPPYLYCIEKTATEEEYSLGEYLEPQEVHDAFGLDEEPARRHSIHPAQPYRPVAWQQDMARMAKYFAAAVGIVFVLLVYFGDGAKLAEGVVPPQAFPAGQLAQPFEVKVPGEWLALRLRASKPAPWSGFDAAVLRDGEPVFSLGKHLSAHPKWRRLGQTWSKDMAEVETYFKVPAEGRYVLSLTGRPVAGATGGRSLSYRIAERSTRSRYFGWLLLLLLVPIAWPTLARLRMESRRWEDED